jgi:hypothetical protein
MADLFSVASPLMIKSPHGGKKVMAEVFPHPDGIMFFEIFWNLMEDNNGVHIIRGELKGDGPWKVGDYVINVLGCQGTDPELAEDFSHWQSYMQTPINDYPGSDEIREVAKGLGASI